MKRQFFQFSDGGVITLDWYLKAQLKPNYDYELPNLAPWEPEECDDCIDPTWIERKFNSQDMKSIYMSENPILVLLPGFNTDSREIWMQNAMKQLKKLGFLVVSVGQRGMQGMTFLGSPKFPSPCGSEDLREVTDYLH